VSSRRARIRRVVGTEPSAWTLDEVATEQPLEIRIESKATAVTMRTPGHDLELVAGFLYTEGVIDGADDIHAMAHVDDPSDPQGNTVDVVLAAGVPAARRDVAQREFFASSSCGVCGKATIERVVQRIDALQHRLEPTAELLHTLPSRLRAAQTVFTRTGGLHGAALFTPEGDLEVLREDIGRHNAVDKVIGNRLRAEAVPCEGRILLISGRAGFELVQKAAVARIPVLAAVGAPSSLAVELAQAVGMALIGFLRDGRFNRYAGLD
jgi:FdhD protein